MAKTALPSPRFRNPFSHPWGVVTEGSPPSWDDLRIVLAVLEEGSLSRAARRLAMSQPTVGRRLSDLEEHFGRPLVERGAGGCTPTTLGSVLRTSLNAMERAAQNAEQLARSTQRSLRGRVRIACGEAVARALVHRLPQALETVPEIRVELLVGMSEVNLVRGDADLAVRNMKPTQNELHARKIARVTFAVYASPSYAVRHPSAKTERRYRDCNWVTLNPEQEQFPTLRWLNDRLEREPFLRASQTGVIVEAVAAGAGLALLSTLMGDADSRLQRVSGVLDDLGFDGYVVTHARSRRIPRVQHVANVVAGLLVG